MALPGYANRIAWIDLSAGAVTYQGVDEDLARKYVGGRGMGVKLVTDNGPGVDPLSPDNILCAMTGPLVGTRAQMSGRIAFVTKSPLTGTVVDSHMGGWSGARLKWAGFDGLVFKGKSAKPVYVFCEDGKVELRDASHVWGRGVHETVKLLTEAHGGRDVSVMAIGPAGENGVRFANWMNEQDRAAGRGGTGCVAGSKNLKAIVVKATDKGMARPADADAFRDAVNKELQLINESGVTGPRKGGLSVYGTNVLMNVINEIGALPTRNSKTTNFEKADQISGEAVKEHVLVADPTCHACPVACKKEVEVDLDGNKLRMESFEYESAWALGGNCGNGDRATIAHLIYLCNDYGMDTIEFGNCLSVAMEAAERGLIEEPVPWGDGETMVRLTHQAARGEGLGKHLAGGALRAARAFGDENLAMHCKGMAIPAYDPRGLKGMGLGYATSNRGACHLRGYTPASEVLGIPEKTDPLAWKGKGPLLKIFQDLHAFSDSMNICKFSAFAVGAEEYAALCSAMTGVRITAEDVLRTGERIYNLERYYNNQNGFGRAHDSLPPRFLKEPGTGAASGSVCELDDMLAEYYAARGWKDGVVPEAKLKELGIV